MKNISIIKLQNHAELMDQAATWFHRKWDVPKALYTESMETCVKNIGAVPQWYIILDESKIIAGIGVIENDFHDRKDLAPNICAVFVEESYRNQGIAGTMLEFVRKDLSDLGIDTLYLLTDHTSFYERYGWEFHCMVRGTIDDKMTRLYKITKIPVR